jgi:hypothetical protein
VVVLGLGLLQLCGVMTTTTIGLLLQVLHRCESRALVVTAQPRTSRHAAAAKRFANHPGYHAP